jgi:histidine phosphotransfer protein HptB
MVESGDSREGQVVDAERMKDLEENLGDGLRDVLESYLEDAPRRIDELRTALERGDRNELQRIAHTLKSSSGIFGAHQMVALCRELETYARDNPLGGETLVEALADAYEKVGVVLNLYLQAG